MACARFGLDGIGDAQQSRGAAIDGGVDHGLSVAAHGFALLRLQLIGIDDPEFFQQRFVSRSNFVASDGARPRLCPVSERNAPSASRVHAIGLRSLDDRRRQRMLAAALQAGDQPHDALFGLAAEGDHGHQLRLALGERAGLVEREGVDLLRRSPALRRS